MRSSPSAMFLAAVGLSRVISKHGINEYLKVFVKDLNGLCKNGISVQRHGGIQHYNVALLSFLADNLGAHQLGGFKESMSFAFRICHSCMATKNHIQTFFNESDFILRDDREHKRQCVILEGSLCVHNSVSFGINRRSILEDVNNFSVVKNMPHDM